MALECAATSASKAWCFCILAWKEKTKDSMSSFTQSLISCNLNRQPQVQWEQVHRVPVGWWDPWSSRRKRSAASPGSSSPVRRRRAWSTCTCAPPRGALCARASPPWRRHSARAPGHGAPGCPPQSRGSVSPVEAPPRHPWFSTTQGKCFITRY